MILEKNAINFQSGTRLTAKGKRNGDDAGYIGSNGRLFHGVAAQERQRHENSILVDRHVEAPSATAASAPSVSTTTTRTGHLATTTCSNAKSLLRNAIVLKVISGHYVRNTKVKGLLP